MACVVALLLAGAEVKKAPDPFFTRVGSGYEAAAELLSGPVSALLVDLAILTPAHAPLLKLAAGLDVPVVAFGTVSAALDGSALAGVCLVGAEEVSKTLQEIITVEAVNEPPSGQLITEEPPIRFDDTNHRQFDKPLTKDELDALLRD